MKLSLIAIFSEKGINTTNIRNEGVSRINNFNLISQLFLSFVLCVFLNIAQ